MKKILVLFILLPVCSWAATTPEQYTINVHVISCLWYLEPFNQGPEPVLRLDVIIGGKKYKLEAQTYFKARLLVLGDYKARLIKDVHPTPYWFSQTYEFLFPDGKTKKFVVVGQSE
ncbi:MAG: hypothetical protein ACP5EP_05520 [Acidobacteriaceae bacterium]